MMVRPRKRLTVRVEVVWEVLLTDAWNFRAQVQTLDSFTSVSLRAPIEKPFGACVWNVACARLPVFANTSLATKEGH